MNEMRSAKYVKVPKDLARNAILARVQERRRTTSSIELKNAARAAEAGSALRKVVQPAVGKAKFYRPKQST